jgi:hypothetical protein
VPRHKAPYYPNWSNDIPQLEKLNQSLSIRLTEDELQPRTGVSEIAQPELNYRNPYASTSVADSSMEASPTGMLNPMLGCSAIFGKNISNSSLSYISKTNKSEDGLYLLKDRILKLSKLCLQVMHYLFLIIQVAT